MKTMITAALVSAVAIPAFAGNPEPATVEPIVAVPAPMIEPGRDWSGAYVGGELGYGKLEADGADGDNGALYGLRAGYDWDLGSYVLGVTGSYSGSGIDVAPGAEVDGLGKLGVRAGYDAGNTLIYASGGYARLMTDGAAGLGDSNGYYVGLGTETYVTDSVSLGGELSYQKFDDFDDGVSEVDGTALNVTANYRF